jgi:hypothetical protein
MRPEEKEWWRRKQHADYEKARDSFFNQQSKRSGGSGGCILLIFLPLASLGIITAAKVFLLL